MAKADMETAPAGAELRYIEYAWADEPGRVLQGAAVLTGLPGEEACRLLGVSDDDVLIYTPSLDKDFLERNFDIILVNCG